MIESRRYIKIWDSDMGNIYLKRIDNRLMLKRYTPLDYDYMNEYIENNADILGERQRAAYDWDTELGYDDWRENYEYDYWNWFTCDSDTDDYYDENDWDMIRDWFYTETYTKEQVIQNVIDCFNDTYYYWNFEWDNIDEARFRQIIWEYYDECKLYKEQLEMAKKPHWNVFKYYKE